MVVWPPYWSTRGLVITAGRCGPRTAVGTPLIVCVVTPLVTKFVVRSTLTMRGLWIAKNHNLFLMIGPPMLIVGMTVVPESLFWCRYSKYCPLSAREGINCVTGTARGPAFHFCELIFIPNSPWKSLDPLLVIA